MASNAQPAANAGPAAAQEFTVRVPKNSKKRYSIIKFNSANVDFTKAGPTKMERENNLREYKTANDMDQLPKFGAGSEYGREQKEEARRKRYGIVMKKYDPEKQPWLLKMGTGKQARKFKGTKEGGINDNASYYVFTQCANGVFEAFPVENWYNFTPVIKYKYLNSDEAEEEYSRRDKTLNYFNIMLRKRMKNEDDDEDEEEAKKKVKKTKKKKDFLLTEMDDWADLSDEEDDDGEGGEDEEDEGGAKKKDKKGKMPAKKKKNARHNSDEEAIEDSDDGENEGREVDYMTSSSSEDEEVVKSKYVDKGVEDEDGLRKLMESGDEDEEEQNKEDKNKEDQDPDAEAKSKKDAGKKESDSDSSGSSSDSDSDDPETEHSFASALFMQKKKKDKVSPSKASENNSDSSRNNSRPGTPTAGVDADKKGKKRKVDTDVSQVKRVKTEPTLTHSSSSSSLSGSGVEAVNEESIRRYLMRKPMTTKDLLQKFRSKKTGLTNDQLVQKLGQILTKLNPKKEKIHDKMYLSIKKPE